MKHYIYLIAAFLFISSLVFLTGNDVLAQSTETTKPGGSITGGVGTVIIDGHPWINFRLQPDVKFLKLGAGLNIDVLYGPTDSDSASVRKEDLRAEKILRYVSWGDKGEKPVYFRIGALDNATLGYGLIMYGYNNQVVEDKRKLGLVFDVNTDMGGVETITSNTGIGTFGRMEIIGGRVYARPLIIAGAKIPVVKKFTVGGTYITDVDPDSWVDSKDAVKVYGADAGLPVISYKVFSLDLIGEFAKISYKQPITSKSIGGSGVGAGIKLGSTLPGGLLELGSILQWRKAGKEFFPHFFDNTYETDRYNIMGFRKADALVYDTLSDNGVFGELRGTVLKKATVMGNLEFYPEVDSSGVLNANANVNVADFVSSIPLTLQGRYYKNRINQAKDVFTLNEHSIATATAGYQVHKYLRAIVDYEWTFYYDDATGTYKSREKVTPRVESSFSF